MATLFNRARVSTATTGTGTITLGAATSDAYFTFAEAGVPDAAVVSYVIEDGTDVEMGVGTYTSSGTTLSRDTVTASKISGTAGTSKIDLSGSAIVFLTPLAAHICSSTEASEDNAIVSWVGTSGTQLQSTPIYADGSGNLIVANSITAGAGSVADRDLHVINEDVATNLVLQAARLTGQSTGTPAAGIGVGLEFEVETAADNYEVGATIEAETTDVTSTSEDFDLVFKTMAAGAAAAERFRIKSTNRLVSPSGQVAHFWVYWTGASTTILAQHNVASIDNDATGDAGINLTTAFSSANYAAFVTTNETGTDGWDADSIQSCGINIHTAGVVDVLCGVMVDGGTAAGNLTNPDQWNACGFGVSA